MGKIRHFTQISVKFSIQDEQEGLIQLTSTLTRQCPPKWRKSANTTRSRCAKSSLSFTPNSPKKNFAKSLNYFVFLGLTSFFANLSNARFIIFRANFKAPMILPVQRLKRTYRYRRNNNTGHENNKMNNGKKLKSSTRTKKAVFTS